MEFGSRIVEEAGAVMPVVNLTDREMEIYSGAGYAMVQVSEGEIDKILYLERLPLGDDVEEWVQELVKFYGETEGNDKEVFYGMMSVGQLCDPIEGGDALTEATLKTTEIWRNMTE